MAICADFSLDADGEYLALRDATGAVVHEFSKLPPGSPFHSYGRNAQGSYVYFDQSHPGAANTGTEFSAIVSAPVASNPGGFLSAATTLTLTSATPGATVRYTDTTDAAGPTDGSEPTANTGIAYGGTLSIGSTRVIRAAAFAPGMIPRKVVSLTYLINEPAPRPNLPAVSIIGNGGRSLYRPTAPWPSSTTRAPTIPPAPGRHSATRSSTTTPTSAASGASGR